MIKDRGGELNNFLPCLFYRGSTENILSLHRFSKINKRKELDGQQ